MAGRMASRGLTALGVALLLTAAAARGDDWLQFRRDERRTAASRDRLKLPLTDVWTMPGTGAVTWRGRVFYLGPVGTRAALYCVDLRTGVPLWKRPLSFPWTAGGVLGVDTGAPLQNRAPVAVSQDGIVYVQDYIPGTPVMGAVSSQGITASFGRPTTYSCKAFRATDGAPLGVTASSPNDPPVPQAILYDGLGAPLNRPVQRAMFLFGPALIRGNELVGSSSADLMFRWAPDRAAGLLSLVHAVPRPGREPDIRPLELGGFPPASAGSGLVVGGMSGNRLDGAGLSSNDRQHLAVINGNYCLWHRDYPWSLGFPTVEQGRILTGAGGGGAENAIMAHDVGTGAVRWVYPPDTLRPDGMGSGFTAAFSSAPGGRSYFGAHSTYKAHPHAYRSHAGIATAANRVYGAVAGSIVALGIADGVPIWSWPIPRAEVTRSVVLSPSHVLASLYNYRSKTEQARLVALRLADGKLDWSLTLPGAGDISLSDGMLFLSDGGVHAFAPAERTYRMAIDSPQAEDYHPLPGQNYEPASPDGAAAGENGEGKSSDREATETRKRLRALADATVVRLQWGEPPEKLIRQVRARQAVAPGLPLFVSVDWLDPTRTTLRSGQAEWTPQEIQAYAAFCERLAREVSPQHLDLAPEVDVYLTRDLSRLPTVQRLLRAATVAVKEASPDTKVLVSLNREVLARRYGRGKYLPFGKLAFLNREGQSQLLSLLDEVDEIGLTSLPQSAFNSPVEIPGDYLLGLKAVLPRKPILLTRLAMQWDETEKAPEVTQASYLKHLIQTAYWLNAELVAYPELQGEKRTAEDKRPDLALRVGAQDRLAAAYWRDTLQWKRVSRLTASAADFDQKLP